MGANEAISELANAGAAETWFEENDPDGHPWPQLHHPPLP